MAISLSLLHPFSSLFVFLYLDSVINFNMNTIAKYVWKQITSLLLVLEPKTLLTGFSKSYPWNPLMCLYFTFDHI
jgi:hypothetical protein